MKQEIKQSITGVLAAGLLTALPHLVVANDVTTLAGLYKPPYKIEAQIDQDADVVGLPPEHIPEQHGYFFMHDEIWQGCAVVDSLEIALQDEQSDPEERRYLPVNCADSKTKRDEDIAGYAHKHDIKMFAVYSEEAALEVNERFMEGRVPPKTHNEYDINVVCGRNDQGRNLFVGLETIGKETAASKLYALETPLLCEMAIETLVRSNFGINLIDSNTATDGGIFIDDAYLPLYVATAYPLYNGTKGRKIGVEDQIRFETIHTYEAASLSLQQTWRILPYLPEGDEREKWAPLLSYSPSISSDSITAYRLLSNHLNPTNAYRSI